MPGGAGGAVAEPRGAEPPQPELLRPLAGAGSRGRPVPARRRSPSRRRHHEPDGDGVPPRPVPVLPGRQGRAGVRATTGSGGAGGSGAHPSRGRGSAELPLLRPRTCLRSGEERAGHGESLLRSGRELRQSARTAVGGCGAGSSARRVHRELRLARAAAPRLRGTGAATPPDPARVSSESLPWSKRLLGTELCVPP